MKLTRLIQTTALVTGTALAVTMGAVPAVAGPDHENSPGQPRNAARAVAAYEAMQEHLYVNDGSSLYLERTVPTDEDRQYSFEWPFSQAHIATLDLTGLPGRAGREFRDDLEDRKVGAGALLERDRGQHGVPGYDSYVRAALRPGRRQVLRRQRVGRPRPGPALPADR